MGKRRILNKGVFLIVNLLLLLVIPSSILAKLVIISPVSNSITETGTITIIGSEDSSDKNEIVITVRGKERGEFDEFSEKVIIHDKVFSLDAELYFGKNEIVIGTIHINVFYNDGTLQTPKEYRKINYHKVVLSGCSNCHDTDEKDLPLMEDTADLCKDCHPQDIKSVIVKVKEKSGRIIKKKKRVFLENKHKPILEGNCLSCHKPHSSPNKGLLREKETSSLCQKCHEKIFESINNSNKVHLPQKEKKCMMCHSPHASNERYLLRSSLKFLCFKCHDSFLQTNEGEIKKNIHYPVKEGECYECHDIHFSEENKYFIKKTARELCFKCHLEKKISKHIDMEKKCFTCHMPHSSEFEFLLINEKKAMCKGCHEKIFDKEFAHGKVMEDEDCHTCHDVHEPRNIEMLENCFNCHNDSKKIKSDHGGFKIPIKKCTPCHSMHFSTGKYLLSKSQHQPFEKGECGSCHAEEGQVSKLIEEGAKLCYKCHESKEKTKDNKQLKYIHSALKNNIYKTSFNSECINCHNPHMTEYEKFILVDNKDLCQRCHGDLLLKRNELKYKNIHFPVKEGKCTKCHDPHGSMINYNLNEKIKTLCFNCHENDLKNAGNGAVVHPPYARGQCTSCHSPHGADPKHLIKDDMVKICVQCHDRILYYIKGKQYSNVHKPVLEGKCFLCHDSHVAKYEENEKLQMNSLCLECHEINKSHHLLRYINKRINVIIDEDFKTDGNDFACIGCHDPHASNAEKLFYISKEATCRKCHKRI